MKRRRLHGFPVISSFGRAHRPIDLALRGPDRVWVLASTSSKRCSLPRHSALDHSPLVYCRDVDGLRHRRPFSRHPHAARVDPKTLRRASAKEWTSPHSQPRSGSRNRLYHKCVQESEALLALASGDASDPRTRSPREWSAVPRSYDTSLGIGKQRRRILSGMAMARAHPSRGNDR